MNASLPEERRARLRGALVRAGREERVSPALLATLLASVAPAPPAPRAPAEKAPVSWKIYAVLAFAAGAAGGTLGVALPSMASSASSRNASPIMTSQTPQPAVDVGDLPSASPLSTPAASHARLRSVPAYAASVADEMALVDRIRSAAASHDDGEALRLLDEHQARFPSGMLAEEADVLRIESHARLARPDTAAQLARRFLDARPASPYAPRVRATLSRLPVSVQEQK